MMFIFACAGSMARERAS